ncbi:MAG: hypothetical protein CVV27_15645, partial [Candidatus Melainabacteria bacterium HGW-Melainabacteria-1]
MSVSIQDSLIQHLENNYAIEGEIGRGGMGVVFRARDKRLDRPVAIKVLHLASSGGAELKAEVIERFQREARVVARLSHPNLVMVYDVGQQGDFYYMIMEFADGKPLNELISERGLPPALVTSIGHQICLALNAAHELNITHRDIKPAVAKLTDFGIAQLNEESVRLTQAGTVIGSIMYASPEQLRDASSVDARSDLYSLGVTMYELLTGQSPYRSEQISQLILEIMSQDGPPSLCERLPEVPPGLELIVQRAMKKSPDERYRRGTEMAHDLARLLQLNAGQPQTFEINFADGTATSPSRSRDSVLMRRTSIDQGLIDSLRGDLGWIERLAADWKPETLATQALAPVLAKLCEPNLFGQSVTGCLRVDQRFVLLLCDGHFVGAADLESGQHGETVFDALPASANSLELRLAPPEQHLVPLLIGNLLESDGEMLHSRLDSSLMDLVPLIENFASSEDSLSGYVLCQSENNLFYYGYDQGQQVFAAVAKPDAASGESWHDLASLASEQGVLIEVRRFVPVVLGPSQEKLLAAARLKLKVLDPGKATLQQLLAAGDDELPIHLIREAKENTRMELELDQVPALRLGERAFDLGAQIGQSIPKR